MPSRHIWAPSEIPPKCKLQRLEKEQCVAEAEKFIAEFYLLQNNPVSGRGCSA